MFWSGVLHTAFPNYQLPATNYLFLLYAGKANHAPNMKISSAAVQIAAIVCDELTFQTTT